MSCPGVTDCRATCLHRQSVEEYRLARDVDEARREHETRMFPGDLALYTGRMITFREWLAGRSQRRERESRP